MKSLILMIVSLQGSLAFLSQKGFKGGDHFESRSMELAKFGQDLSFQQCTFACLQSKPCNGLKYNNSCYLTDKFAVRTSASSSTRTINFWRSIMTPVTHFLVVNPISGEVYDISADESLSPSITFDVSWPTTDERPLTYILHDNLTLVIMGRKTVEDGLARKYQVWNIGDSKVTERDVEVQTIDTTTGTAAASLGDVIYSHGGSGESWGYVNSNWRQLKPFGAAVVRKNTCVSFIPGDKNRVYFIGTKMSTVTDSDLHEYRFDTDSYRVVKARDGRISAPGCTGFRSEKGYRFFVTVAGQDGPNFSPQVLLFTFATNTWSNLPDFPILVRTLAVVEDKGILYAFGGVYESGEYNLNVYKLNWKTPTTWTVHSKLPSGLLKTEALVIPYN